MINWRHLGKAVLMVLAPVAAMFAAFAFIVLLMAIHPVLLFVAVIVAIIGFFALMVLVIYENLQYGERIKRL